MTPLKNELIRNYGEFKIRIIQLALSENLPDILNWNDIAYLWASRIKKIEGAETFCILRSELLKDIIKSVSKGELHSHHMEKDIQLIDVIRRQGIEKNEFKEWLNQNSEWPIDDCLLSLWWNEEETTQIHRASPQNNRNKKREQSFTQWLRETWEKEGCPSGSAFFIILKKYKNTEGSPIKQHHTLGGPNDKAGLTYSDGSSIKSMTKKTIENKVSEFKKPCQYP